MKFEHCVNDGNLVDIYFIEQLSQQVVAILSFNNILNVFHLQIQFVDNSRCVSWIDF